MKPVEIEFLVKDNTRQGLSGVSGGIDGVERDATAAQKRIAALEAQIVRLQKVMAQSPKMDQTENIRQIDALQRELVELQAASQKIDLTPRNAPAAMRTYNGLNVSIQQIARELPSLAMGPQMFFLAISNNLPVFTDELARARKEYDALVASGQKGVPVWKQVLSSIGSLQTLMAVGIMLSVSYGKEIGNFFSKLFRGKAAFDAARRSAEAFHATMVEGSRNAQQEVVKLNLLYRAATDHSRAMNERLDAVRKLREEYPDYFKNLSDEQILVGKAGDAYKTLIANIYAYAKAQAAFKSMVDLEQQGQIFDNTADIDRFRKAYDKYIEAIQDKADKQKIFDALPWYKQGNATKEYQDLTWAGALVLNAKRDVDRLQKLIFEEVRKYKGGEELVDEIEEKFDGDLGAFLQFIEEQRTKLASVAEQAQLMDDPSGKKRKGEGSKKSVDQDSEQYRTAILRQRQELDEQTVALMDKGAEKERATIRLNYEKKRQEYEQQERETLALIKKLRAAGADLDAGAERSVMAATAQAIAGAAKIRDKELSEVDKRETESFDKLLQKYETYEQGRLRIAEKYDKEIVELSKSAAGRMMQSMFQGNVNLLSRPLIDAAKLVQKGWEDAGDGIATVFSSQYGILDASGKVTEILVTPILPDGNVLSPQELEDYVFDQLQGSESILTADSKKIVIGIDVDSDGSAGEVLHELQEVFYGLSQGSIPSSLKNYTDAAERAKQKALDDFAVQFAGQFPQFEAWADAIVSASVEKLTDLLIEAQEELDNLQSETPDAGNAIAIARAKVIELERQITKLDNKQQIKSTDTTNWTKLHRVLTDVVQTFDEVGDAIGGAGGKIVSAAGNIAGSTLQLVNAAKAYKNADSDDKIGKASAILGAVSAGVGVITTIVRLFEGGETSFERNLRLAREFNEELRIMRERARIDSDEFETIFGDRLFARYAQNVDVAREALERFERTQEEVRRRGEEIFVGPLDKRQATTGLSGLAEVEKTWESAAESIANMQVQTRHSTWFRSAKYASLRSLLPELFTGGELDMEALRWFVDEGGETFQHLTQENQQMLRRMADDWETYEEALASIKDYLTNIFGELGGTLTDALVDAFENGTDAANTFVDSVGQALRSLAKDMVYSATLGPVFEAAQQRMNAIAESAGSDEEKFSQWSQTLGQMVSDALGKQSEFNRLWEEFRRIAAENGLSIDSIEGTAQSGKAGATRTVTQESFSRVEGLVTSMQIHLANMDDGLEGITPTLGASLDALNKIVKNTDHLPSILALLEELKRDGLKVL